jgi:hypothetical protein
VSQSNPPQQHCPRCDAEVNNNVTMCLHCGSKFTQLLIPNPTQVILPGDATNSPGSPTLQLSGQSQQRRNKPFIKGVVSLVLILVIVGGIVSGLFVITRSTAQETGGSSPSTTQHLTLPGTNPDPHLHLHQNRQHHHQSHRFHHH